MKKENWILKPGDRPMEFQLIGEAKIIRFRENVEYAGTIEFKIRMVESTVVAGFAPAF